MPGIVLKAKEYAVRAGMGPPTASRRSKGLRVPGEGETIPFLGSDDVSSSAGPPVMADLFAGPHAPLSKAFLFCGWRCLPVNIKLDDSHDLSNPLRQDSLRKQLNQFHCSSF